MKSPVKTLFLHEGTRPVDGKLDLILSPSLYWFRREALPVKTAARARKLAPAFFDALLPAGEYEFAVFPEEEGFQLFAYESEKIRDLLGEVGIRPSQVRRVYFAQTECMGSETALQVDAARALVGHDGVVSLMPLNYVRAEQSVQAYCESTSRSSHSVPITLSNGGTLISDAQATRLGIVVFLLCVLMFGDFMLQRQKYAAQLQASAEIASKYALPPTSMQRESILRSLERTEAQQIALRKRFKRLITLPLKKGEVITSMVYEKNKARLEIKLVDAKRAEPLKKALHMIGRVTAAKLKDNSILSVSLAYE